MVRFHCAGASVSLQGLQSLPLPPLITMKEAVKCLPHDEMLVNDGAMSVWSYTHFTIIDEHFTMINGHFTIINKDSSSLTSISPSFTSISPSLTSISPSLTSISPSLTSFLLASYAYILYCGWKIIYIPQISFTFLKIRMHLELFWKGIWTEM